MEQPEYMTVGQLARRVGVTVRTIQYYDQQGLLSPSAKGVRNQRLYLNSDADDLYKILALKYLGLSLSEIKQYINDVDDPAVFKTFVSKAMEEKQNELQNILRKLTTLSSLLSDPVVNDTSSEGSFKWRAAVDLIERGQNDSRYFWSEEPQRTHETAVEQKDTTGKRSLSVGKWHELIADTIFAISQHIPVDDVYAEELADRYRELDGANTLVEGFVLMENIMPSIHGEEGSFESLRQSVSKYLEQAIAAHPKGQ